MVAPNMNVTAYREASMQSVPEKKRAVCLEQHMYAWSSICMRALNCAWYACVDVCGITERVKAFNDEQEPAAQTLQQRVPVTRPGYLGT
jgi:hypothetical protein